MKSGTIRTLIVDDEMPARRLLSTYLKDYCADVEVCAECDSVESAVEAISRCHPHLLFLDIEMPGENGFDLLRKFEKPPFRVVFVTAYSEYAIRAFRFSAVDYLLKPVKVDELIESVAKFRQSADFPGSGKEVETLLRNLSSPPQSLDNLVISSNNGLTVIRLAEVILCQGEGYCTHFYLSGKRKITSSKNLKYFEELLLNHLIMRVHHSWLVNLHQVSGVSRQGEILCTDDLKCPLGSTYKPQFLSLIGKFR